MGYSNGKISGSVSHSDINAVLGTAYKTNRELCTANAISVNAFYKPTNCPLNGPLTEGNRRSYNWGWKTLGGAASADTLYEALVAKWDGGTWEKNLPYGGIGISPYRLQDFNGYDHNADTPFKIELASSSITQGAALRFSMLNIGEAYNLSSWGFFGGVAFDKIGLGVYIGSSKPSANGFWVYMLAGYNFGHTLREVLDDSEKLLNIPATYLNERGITSGTYYMIPFFTVDTSAMTTSQGYTTGSVYCTDSSGYMSMILPTSKLQFSVAAASKPIDNIEVTLEDNSQVTMSRGSVTIPSLTLSISNRNSSAYSVTVSLVPAGDAYNVSGSFATKTVLVAAGSSTTVEMVSSTVSWSTSLEVAFCTMTITCDGQTRTEQLTIYKE